MFWFCFEEMELSKGFLKMNEDDGQVHGDLSDAANIMVCETQVTYKPKEAI